MELRILGPVEAWGPDGQLVLDGSKQRTVLAALLLANVIFTPSSTARRALSSAARSRR